jgi:phosphoribosylglycinamide formyltransferase 1
VSLPIAVLVSGGGSNLQSLIDHVERGSLDARIVLVVSNKPGAYGLKRAERHNIPRVVVAHADYPGREAFDRELVRLIHEAGAEAVVLAGFMRILTPTFLRSFPQRVLNIHPALLPSFPGVHGQAQAVEHGVRLSGCTVHFVDEEVDHGPIIIQAAVPVLEEDDEDSLGGRILSLEHRILPQAVQWLAQKRLKIEGRKVRLGSIGKPRCTGEDFPCLVQPPLEPGF